MQAWRQGLPGVREPFLLRHCSWDPVSCNDEKLDENEFCFLSGHKRGKTSSLLQIKLHLDISNSTFKNDIRFGTVLVPTTGCDTTIITGRKESDIIEFMLQGSHEIYLGTIQVKIRY